MKIETRHEPDGYWHAIDADNYEAEGVDDTEIGAIRNLLDQIEGRQRTAERQR